MKKLLAVLLVCVLLTSVFVSEAAAQSVEVVVTPATVDGQIVHKQVSVETELKQLKISKSDDFDWIALPNCSHISELGNPALPIKSIVVKLPRDTKVIGVESKGTTTIAVPGVYRIAPALQPHLISTPSLEGKFSEPLSAIYESKVLYPGKLFDVYNSKGRDGNYVIIYFYPVRYVPVEGRLTLITEATFDVEYTIIDAKSIRPLQNTIDEVIITVPAYYKEATRLADWRNLTGIEAAVFNTTWIYYNYEGDDPPRQIRNFIRYMFDNHSIKYVLLFGDADDVPPRYAYIPDGHEAALVPTDYYYECLDGTWDTNGDGVYADLAHDLGVDFIPEVSAGRISVNADTAGQVVTKIIQYEQNVDPAWFEKMVLVGTDTFTEYPGAEGEILKDYVEDILQDNFTFTKLYETQGTLSPSAISNNINSGCGALNFAGHGNYNIWGLGNAGAYYNSNVASLINGNKLPIVATLSCLTGGFDYSGNCIGEEFLRTPHGGCIAYVGATRSAWAYVGYNVTAGLAGELDWQFWDSYNFNITKPGPMLTEAKVRYMVKHPLYTYYSGYGYLDEKTVLEYVLLGDPVIMVDTTPPASITNLQNTTYAQAYINWTWNDPVDADLSHVMVYVDEEPKENITKGVQYYNATGFDPDTEHTIATKTVDVFNNVNQTWVNSTARTAAAGRADLVITDTWVCWPDNCTICYNVTNTGNGTAPVGHNTTLFVEGVEAAYDPVDAVLVPNESYTGCFDGYNWIYTPPNDNITVCADSNNTIAESDETNNCMFNTWKCGDVDGNGIVNIMDVRLLMNHVNDQSGYPIEEPWAGDVDGDADIDGEDVQRLLAHVFAPEAHPLNCRGD